MTIYDNVTYLEYLRDVRKLSFWSVQVHYSAIHHFFEINDVALNSRKSKRLGEEIKDSNPLIRNKITADNPFLVKTPKSIKVRSIQQIVKKLKKEAGIVLKDKKEIANCHGRILNSK